MISIEENLKIINDKINNSILKSNRAEKSVKLLAVSKFHPVEEIIQAVDCNQFMFGENHVQEAKLKFPSILEYNKNVSLHMIGQLQTNKVKDITKICDCIQSVDRKKLICEIEKQCEKINKTIKILFEIHTGEESKSGFTDEKDFYEVINDFSDNKYPHIIPCGFMTMAPFTKDEKLIHNSFKKLRLFQEKIQKEYPEFDLSELSMGMSNDFEIAIEEGSTIVRVGTAIFGERNYNK